MRNIFIGFLLVFINFSIDTSGSKIGLIPDFLGYIFILRGLEELVDKSMFFKIKPYVTGMIVYSLVLYFFDLFGFSLSYRILTYIFAFISTVISLFISYNIVMGINDMERIHGISLNGDRLNSMWRIYALVVIISYVLIVIPLLAIFSIIASFVITVFFLIEFNTTKKMYYEKIR